MSEAPYRAILVLQVKLKRMIQYLGYSFLGILDVPKWNSTICALAYMTFFLEQYVHQGNISTRQYLEPFLGPQKGMQMLTVITIFFFFGWLFSKSIFPVNTFKSEHIVNIEAILLLFSFLADCPAGTKYDGLSKCLDCPLNSYQDRTAQSRCKPCPRNHVTDTLKSVTIYQCKG